MTYKKKEEIQTAEMMISPPGETLEDTLNAKGISQSELARRMGRPQKTINEIINAKAAITSETAIQLERILGVSAEFWMEREKNYQLELEKIRQAKKLLALKDWLKNFPLSTMRKWGWIDYKNNDILDKASTLFRFFAVSGKEAYENYFTGRIEGAFRSSGKKDKNPHIINVWLRKGELQAQNIEASQFDSQRFREALNEIKMLMARQPDNFFEKLQRLGKEAGVKIIHTPALPGLKIHGSTRWLGDNPVIQLSNQFKRNDIFWFTFFHEAGHILKHGKKDVFVDGPGFEYSEKGKAKEQEADTFAINYTFSKKNEKRLLEQLNSATEPIELIHRFAREINTHPAVIVGRLAKKKRIHDSEGWRHNIYQKIDLAKLNAHETFVQ